MLITVCRPAWPILAAFFLALCVILDRALWWLRLRSVTDPALQQQARDAIGSGDFPTAWNLARDSAEPYLRNLGEGITHARTSMLAAMQLDATHLIEKSEARMWVLSTLITLAPLLGLFGTVVGIMGSFSFVGDEQLGFSGSLVNNRIKLIDQCLKIAGHSPLVKLTLRFEDGGVA